MPGSMVIIIVSVAPGQAPPPVGVSTMVTVPATVSAGVALYTAFIEVASGVNVPVPSGVDHIPVEGTDPISVVFGLLAQTV